MVEIGINQGTVDTNLGLTQGYIVDAHKEKRRDGSEYLYVKIDGKDPTGRKKWAQVIAQLDVELIDELHKMAHDKV